MTTQRRRLFVLAALLAMSCELHALRPRNSYTLPRLRPRARNLADINAATLPMDEPQSGQNVGSGRDFYKKFMLFRDMFQQPTAGNVIVITQPATTGTPTTTTTTPTTPTTTTTTTTTSTPTTNSTSRSVGRKHAYVQNAPVLQDVGVDDDDDDDAAAAAALLLDDRLDRLEMAQQASEAQSATSDTPKRKLKHKQQKQKRKHVKQRKVNAAPKQIRKLKKRHRHVKHKNANKTRQKQQQIQQQPQQQQQPLNIYNSNGSENYNRIENGNTSTRLQQMWQALRRQTPIERGRSSRRGRSFERGV